MVFSTLSKREILILPIFNLSSANSFNLVTPKILSFGERVNWHRMGMTEINDKGAESTEQEQIAGMY